MKHLLTNPQNSIWLTEQYYTNTSVNNVCGYVYISDVVNFEVLKDAINLLVKTNDGMRLKFTEENNSCVQYVDEYKKFDIEMLELSSEKDIEIQASEIASIPFEIKNNFLFKFTLFKLPNGSGGYIYNSHHIIGDSWTLGLVAKESTEIYSKLLSNEYVLENYPSYLNYIEYENNYKNSDKFNKDKAFWDEIYKTVPEIASIPYTKNISSNSITCKGTRKKFIIPKKELMQIKDFCAKNQISIYNFFMASYCLYIGRVCNLDDFVIGTPILNRTNYEQKNTMGMFVSTVPLRINLNHNLPFIDFTKKIATDTMAILRHQRYPYQFILEELRKKDSSVPNLYNIVLSYQITKTIEENSNIKYSTDWIFNGCSADDFQIHIFDLNDESAMTVAYDYKVDKYDETDIQDLHARILTIIQQIVENNTILLKDIEIVTPEEKHKILYEFNNTQVDYPKNKTIVDLFEEQVKKTPDNIAVVFEDKKLTYKELNEKANQLARYLIEKGVNKKDVIGLRINKSLEMIIGILAIIKSGACYLPMNMAYPEDRVNFMLKDSNSKLLLTSKKLTPFSYNIPALDIDLCNTNIYNKDTKNIGLKLSPEDLIYIIYTSGSTGKPKGAMICHRNVVRLMKNNNYLFDFNEKDIWTMFHSVAFDFSVWEMYGALLYGGKLILVPDDTAKDPKLFLRLLRKEKVTVLNQTPTYFYNLQNQEITDPNHNLKIRYIIFGGEALNPLLLQPWHEKYSKTNLINMYGITETTVHVTFKSLLPKDLLSKTSNIGKPIPTLHVLILDKYKNLLPFGVKGEMYVLGDGVFKGYLNRNDLNQEKLLYINKFSDKPIYKSADSAIMHKNGELEYIGRIDTQVKIRGFRVELEEIKQRILKYSNIENCIVCKKSDSNNREFLCAYYIKKGPINIHTLKNSLAQDLPNYMIPQYFIEIAKIPTNINGKLDINSLPIPETISEEIGLAPKSNIDNIIYKVYQSVLGITHFGMQNSFYDLGGDSLTAITISSKLSTELGKEITVKDILEHPILIDLSTYIESLISEKINIITPTSKASWYPLSSAQKRIYYASSIDNQSTLYNIAGGIIIDKLLNIDVLEKCFHTLIDKHEALRTHFEIKSNEVVQIIDNTVDFNLKLENQNTENLNKIYADFVKPFDLTKAPLFRAKAVRIKNNKMFLLLDMHHIISDGASLSILLQELCDLYNGSTFPQECKIDYKDFCLWEKEQFKTEKLKKAKEFWVNKYQDDIPLLNMPTCYPRPSMQSFEGSNYHSFLDEKTYEKITLFAKDLNITPYMLLLSVYYILLSKYTSQEDIVIGTPIVGRELPELSTMLGMFVNTLALRNKIDYSLSFEEFSNNIKESCLSSFEHQNYPFDELVKELNIKRDTSRNPLFDVMFIYQNNGYPEINFKDAKTEYFIPDNPISKFDLSLEIIPVRNSYSLRFEYCTKLFDEAFIKRFSSHYINILNTVLKNKEIKISDIDMLSEEEKNQILYDFNNTKIDYPKDKTIIDLFEEQVEKTPNNIAIVFENQKLTYKELNEKANQLARFLLANNATIGDIICILLDKSIEMIISILGILKVGATFLPIDISYPNERIDYMIRDSKSNILLTSQNFIHKVNNTVQSLCIDFESSQFLLYDNSNLFTHYDTDNLAYIMYTSGSTGNPKGVMVTHKNIVRLVKNNKFINFENKERILQTGSIVFDACTFEIWGALLNGFELFIIKKEDLLDASILKNYLEENKITTLWITAPLFNQLSESNPLMFKSVKKLLTGGDVLSPKHINEVRKVCPNLQIINGYGPTENTTFSCCFTIDKEYSHSIPIGKPISNSTAYVVSPTETLCPIGIPGELWVGGDGVSKGYLNNETLTNEKFISNPFGKGIIYKTGDLAKWLPDGNIEFIGRIDGQVKIRGFRIELNEINKKLIESSYIKEAYTTTKLIDNTKYICSYIVTKNNFDLNIIKKYLSNYLPSYMIPTYFIKLKKLPINQNGKVDKNALPSDFKDFMNTHNIKEASSEEEILLLSLFKKVLNNDNIGVSDSFFELGGDSLTAMKLQVEAISHNLDLSYADIFKYCTVENLIKNMHTNKKNIKVNYNFDYDKYNALLKNNTLEKEILCNKTEIGNVFLTGFTGFLGAHILDSFIKKETGKIYCLIRDKNNMSARERLFNVLHFYFEDKYDILVDNRIILVDGDITLPKFGLSEQVYNTIGNSIKTVIHSAALVKHYGMYQEFENINVHGTQHVIEFSQQFNLNLLHISTISVSGNNLAEGSNINNYFGKEMDYDENNFYIGQNLENLYVKSKFEAEKNILDAISKGLSACIIRMGNLTSRFSEGKFQQNHFENAFVNRLKSFLQIGVFPENLLNLYCEFTPIDYCGDAIIEIARHFNPNYTVFHLLNEKHVYLDRLFQMLNELGIHTKLVSEKEFAQTIQSILEDSSRKQVVEGIINDLTSDKKLVYKSEVNIKSDFTKEFLYKTGFEWPYIDINYIRNYFKYLIDIGYFNIKII